MAEVWLKVWRLLGSGRGVPAISAMQRRDERGFALLIVLWSLSVLTLLCMQLVTNARFGAQLASNIRISAELEAAADAGLHEAMFRMLNDSNQRWRADGSWRQLQSPYGAVDVMLESLDGKINPNIALVDLLSALFRQVGLRGGEAFNLATKIQEWRVPGRWPRTLQVKAEEYRAAGRDYGPPGTPFQSLDELRNVLGMTPELFARIQPYLSVYTQDDPDKGIADAIVQRAMVEAAGPKGYDSPGHGRDHAVSVRVVASGRNGAQSVRRAVVWVGIRGDRPWRLLAIQDNR